MQREPYIAEGVNQALAMMLSLGKPRSKSARFLSSDYYVQKLTRLPNPRPKWLAQPQWSPSTCCQEEDSSENELRARLARPTVSSLASTGRRRRDMTFSKIFCRKSFLNAECRRSNPLRRDLDAEWAKLGPKPEGRLRLPYNRAK